MRRWKSGRPSAFRQPEWKSQYSPTRERPFSAANLRIASRCASGEKPCPCSSVDSRTYATARSDDGSGSTPFLFVLHAEVPAAAEPPVGEPAREVGDLRMRLWDFCIGLMSYGPQAWRVVHETSIRGEGQVVTPLAADSAFKRRVLTGLSGSRLGE
jgi:hypothetical protein